MSKTFCGLPKLPSALMVHLLFHLLLPNPLSLSPLNPPLNPSPYAKIATEIKSSIPLQLKGNGLGGYFWITKSLILGRCLL